MKTVLLACLAVLVVVSGALAAVNLALDRTDVKTYAVGAPVREIVVKADSGNVRLIPASGKGVQVRETQHYIFKRPKLDRDVTGGVLTLDSHCNGFVLNCSADLRVTVPAGIEVTVDADSGNVDADEISVSDAHLKSDSGNVRAELAGSQGLLWAHTDSGNVEVVAANARAIDTQTDSGNVKVEAVAAPRRVVAHTDSGNVAVAVPAGEYAVDTDTDSGDLDLDERISRNDRSPRSIDAKTDSGNVKVRAR
jgi:hypothetical protein